VNKLLVIVLAGCGVSNAHDGIDPSQSSTNADTLANGATTNAPCHRYHIEEIPTPVPGGDTTGARAICSGGVVGTADITPNVFHAVLYKDGQLTDLGTLGGPLSNGEDGNAQGTIVGSSNNATFNGAFAYRDGVMTELPGIGGEDARAWAINNREEIAGVANIPPNGGGGDTDNHAILWEPDATQAIDLTALNGGHYSYALDINDQGELVGTDILPDNHSRAVVWRDRVLVELDDGGAPDSQANAINQAGTIAGFIETAEFAHAVIWQDDTMIDLGALTGSPSGALGIDNSGDVVGSARASGNSQSYAFLYSQGSIVDLNASLDQTGWYLYEATDVCDDGRIVGNGAHDGIARGFVLTPGH
jgi:probable HAF family extracellular repeat protein